MIPKSFHLTAPSKTLSWEERRIQLRLHKLLADWQGHLWDDADNSALMRNAFPQFAAQYEAIPFGVLKADIARCAYMHVYGGFYFDTDYKLIKPIAADLLNARCLLPIEEGRVGAPNFKIGNAVFASEPNYPLWSDFIHYLFQNHDMANLRDHREITAISGPRGLTTFYQQHGDAYPDIVFPDRDDFHPDRTWFGLGHKGSPSTFGLHLCWASWRGKSLMHATTNFVRRKLTAPI
ncbi:MAG TPA: glycosyltransferase [Spongiibacteraceae bacterium]